MLPVPENPVSDLPETVPVMVLSGCTLFPGCLLPLFIFEPRYREMLDHTLEQDRIFCIGTARPGIDHEADPNPVHSVSTAGIVRACVTHENGTSHLVLLGLGRVRLTGWEQEEPFRIARIEPVAPENNESETALTLVEQVVDLAGQLAGETQGMSERLHEHLSGLDDTSAVADVVAHNFVTEPEERQILLEAADVTERLHILNQHLQRRLED